MVALFKVINGNLVITDIDAKCETVGGCWFSQNTAYLLLRILLHSFITEDCFFFTFKSTCDEYFAERTQIRSYAPSHRVKYRLIDSVASLFEV